MRTHVNLPGKYLKGSRECGPVLRHREASPSSCPPTPVSGAPNASLDPYQSRGSTACWSKSSIDLKQLCAIDHYILIRVAYDCKEHSVCCETWLCLCTLLCAQEPVTLVHQVPALSLALLRGKTKGWAGRNHFFSRDDFSTQHQKLSFWGFGVAEEERTGDKIDEWQIDGFHFTAEKKNKRCTSGFFFFNVSRVWQSYFWQIKMLACTFPCTSEQSGSFSNIVCVIHFLLCQLDKHWGKEARAMLYSGNHLHNLNDDVILSVLRSQIGRLQFF